MLGDERDQKCWFVGVWMWRDFWNGSLGSLFRRGALTHIRVGGSKPAAGYRIQRSAMHEESVLR